MNLSDLDGASYRGAFFYVKSSEVAGGRKDAKKEFIDSDLQIIEDLGKKQRAFTINGIVSERRDNSGNVILSYFQVRDALLAALEKGKTGILIHPWYGEVLNVVCRTFTMSEDVTRLGECNVNMSFEISNTDGVPLAIPSVLSKVATGTASAIDTATGIFAEIWNIAEKATGNFQAGVDKANGYVDSVNEATKPIAKLANEIDQHTNLLNTFSSNVVTLVSSPADLSNSIYGIMESIDNLYESPSDSLFAFKGLFNFGDNDINSPYKTSISVQKKTNNDVFNNGIQSAALSYSYLNASQIEYKTVLDINETETDLEEQYQKLFRNEDMYPELVDSLTDLRTITQGFFNEQKLIASQIINVNSNRMSTRLLAFNYYGESTDGEAIAELNGLYDLASIQGDIRIFTE
jgi:prophage DNA circulation protein